MAVDGQGRSYGSSRKATGGAKSELAKKHLQGDVATLGNLYDMVNASQLALPNHPIDPAKDRTKWIWAD